MLMDQLQSIVNLWILTFTHSVAATMDNDDLHVIAAIVATLRSAKKDKVIRSGIAALRVCTHIHARV